MTDDDVKRLRELAERARKPQGWKRIAFQAARLDEFREAASPDVVIRLLDELDRLRHENHNLNWALGTDGYEQMYTEAERVEHADAVARITEHLDRLAARKARLDALVPAGVDILDHIDAMRRERDEAVQLASDFGDALKKRIDEVDAAMALLAEARGALLRLTISGASTYDAELQARIDAALAND